MRGPKFSERKEFKTLGGMAGIRLERCVIRVNLTRLFVHHALRGYKRSKIMKNDKIHAVD